MTVHVISVGLSVLDALRDPRRSVGDKGKPDLARAIIRNDPAGMLDGVASQGDGAKVGASDWLANAFAAAVADGPAAQFAVMAHAVRPDLWPRDISAEVETFDRVPGSGLPLRADDVAVLVCSDTPEGLLAAAWNAAALTAGDLTRIQYLADPRGLLGSVRGSVLLARIPGLDAGDERGFREAMGGLGTLGHSLLRSGGISGNEAFRFYLSGGFKAAIPYLIGLAEGLRSLRGRRQVEAFVLHETARDSPPIRLPLRRMVPERVQSELKNLSETPTRREPSSDFLDGYAYEQAGDTWRLTAFGVGLKALFDIPPPGLGQ